MTKKILDTDSRDFYLYENTKRLSLENLKDILRKTKRQYNKAKEYSEEKKMNAFLPSAKQWLALQSLDLKNTTKTAIALGGGVGGAKTALGAYWIISNALMYPGTAYGVGRNSLTVMEKTTIPSFKEMLEILKVPASMYKFNSQKHTLTFNNGSVIFFVELKYRPDDSTYTRVRGLQITAAFIDEANEINEEGIYHLSTRVGRKKNGEYGLKGKTLYTFNPSKGYVKRKFFDPWKKGALPKDTVYIPSLAINNPFIPESYIEDLWKLPDNIKQTQLLGNFDYDDADNAIVSYQDILNSFDNIVDDVSNRYLVVDISGVKGADNTVFSIWRGWEVYEFKVKQNMTPDAIIEEIRTLATQYDIPMGHITVDAIGVGESIAYSNRLSGIFPFKSSSSVMLVNDDINIRLNKYNEVEMGFKKKAPQYLNLRSQVAWVLANQMKKGQLGIRINSNDKIKIHGEDKNLKEVIIEELSLLRDKNYGQEEKKRQLIGKSEMKDYINRSPDILDVFLMRGVFELTKKYDIINERKVDNYKDRKFYKKRINPFNFI